MNYSKFLKQNGRILLILILAIMAILSGACTSSDNPENDEESAVELTLDETYDQVHTGIQFILSHDATSNSFNGFVENTTNGTIKGVRVEVHLSNGVELGPTTPLDLAPGENKAVRLLAKNSVFDTWSAHLEVTGSTAEHSDGED